MWCMSFGADLGRLLLVLLLRFGDDPRVQRLLVERVVLLEHLGRVEADAELAVERLAEPVLVPHLLGAFRRHVLA